MKISVSVDDADAIRKLRQIKKGLGRDRIARLQSQVAAKSLRRLIFATPKGWTGHTRQSWTMIKRFGRGVIITNTSKTMLFLEKGTVAHGPTKAKFLFIPLTRRAAISGWSKGMVFGKDFVLTKQVKGIRAMRIVAKERKRVQTEYRKAAGSLIRRIIK